MVETMRMIGVLIACAVLFLTPAAAAQFGAVKGCSQQCTPAEVNDGTVKTGKEPVNYILYPHFDGIQRAPLNTQAPPEGANDENRGSPGVTPNVATPHEAARGSPGERLVWWSTPGFVSYPEGRAYAEHQEFGLADDVQIAPGMPLTLYFYVSAHQVPNQNGDTSPVEAGVVPNLALYAQIETGRNSFSEKSTLVAWGDTGTTGGQINVVTLPNTEETIYEIRADLKVEKDFISSKHDDQHGGYIVSVILYQFRTTNWDYEASQNDYRIRTGSRFLPRIIIPIEEPMQTTTAWMNRFQEKVFLRWSILADFGSYDIREDSFRLDIQGPDGPVDPAIVTFEKIKHGVGHESHFVPSNKTWGLDYRKVPLADGEYTATATAQNLQRTYQLSHTFKFIVKGGVPQVGANLQPAASTDAPAPQEAKTESQGLPGFETVAVAAAATAAAFVGRRRR